MTTLSLEQQGPIISVHLATDESINAWSGRIEFANTYAVERIFSGDTSMMWQTPPTIEGGQGISFSGGVPHGVQGDVVLFRFALKTSVPSLRFSNATKLYLNDGKGTEAAFRALAFTPSTSVSYASSSLPEDHTPPEPFTPMLYRDSQIFGNAPVVLFSTTDSDSGIRNYEVREITTQGASGWHVAESPYVVNNDVLRLEIRAYDNAGNVREEVFVPPHAIIGIPVVAAFLSATLLLVILYNKRKRWQRR